MSRIRVLFFGAALALTIAPAAVLAQNESPPSPNASTTTPNDQQVAPGPAPAAQGAAVDASGSMTAAQAMPAGQMAALANGDNQTVTNGPVPDTPANRAKYGRPMSHAGKQTAPAGN